MRVFDSWRTWADAEPVLRKRLPTETIDALKAAYEFAVERHGDQTRPAGEPYVEHLMQTLEIVLDVAEATWEPILLAALLHDVVEDTDTTVDEVRERFGDDTAEIVARVTKPEGDREKYLASFADAPAEVLTVKLADRYSNVQRLDTHPEPDKRQRYYVETVRWFVPLTRRVPRFAPYFETWQREFAHLDGPELG